MYQKKNSERVVWLYALQFLKIFQLRDYIFEQFALLWAKVTTTSKQKNDFKQSAKIK